MASRRSASVLTLLSGAVVCAGCLSPNLYTTPKMLPLGDARFTVAAEGYYDGQIPKPLVPSVRARVGVGGSSEVQLALGPEIVGLGLGVGVVQSRFVDLALLPRLTVFVPTFEGGWGAQADAIAQLGLQWSSATTLLFNGGVGHVLGSPRMPMSFAIEGETPYFYPSGLVARLGLGIEWRVGKRFSLQPEFTFQRYLGDPKTNVYALGLGFQFGAQPYP